MTMIRIAGLFCVAAIASGAVNYSYDAAGRLTKVDYSGGKTLTYAYDNAGNLLSRISTSGSVAPNNKKSPDKKSVEKTSPAPEKSSSDRLLRSNWLLPAAQAVE